MCSVIPKKIVPIINAIRTAGGHPFLVGGAVRDALITPQKLVKDFDFEVYHISIDRLIQTLSRFGTVETVGRSFGVIKLFMTKELNLDFALPRRESKIGRGHRGFVVSPDPDMPKREACARRDFTINAMLMDPTNGTILDYHGGRDDLENRILRHTSDHFDEDPLRPLRGMQFAARFDLTIHATTLERCRSLASEALGLAPERIFGEWEKWALYARLPSRGVESIAAMGWDQLFGDLTAKRHTGSSPGSDSPWLEILAAVDRAAILADSDTLCRQDRILLLFGALCHTLSEIAASRFLERIGTPLHLSSRLKRLLTALRQYPSKGILNTSDTLRLAVRLKPERIRDWLRLLSCTAKAPTAPEMRHLLEKAERLGVADAPPAPLVTGKSLMKKGVAPGPKMGEILKHAFDAQLSCRFRTPIEADNWLDAYLSTKYGPKSRKT
jgi:tRNA nucleotidyltransferase (CCA-adding enzyme)